MRALALSFSSSFSSFVLPGSAKQGENQPGSVVCPISQWRYGGATNDYCLNKNGCRCNCNNGDTAAGGCGGRHKLGSILTREMFEEMLHNRNDTRCPAAGFYTYEAFVAAAKSFPAFATTGDDATRMREVAAFFGQTSHETTGGLGWNAPGGPYAWGYCYNKEIKPKSDYCDRRNQQFPCALGQKYYGRGPIQLSWNYNYGKFGASIGQQKQLLENPDLLLTDATLSFRSALWFWMTPQWIKPSCHDVIVGAWMPLSRDEAAGRLPGYGLITNIINGGQCGRGRNTAGEDRIGFYKRYCDMFGVSYGDYLDCYNQRNFGKEFVDDMSLKLKSI
ncbi:Endochitinase 1 [Hibiscus syriacus]|uniref:chitinase n=1 Tax=Hibiscus syriacus TaxID=106335 RepID=A0A6A2XBB5_HIBSY|nr:endochitinase-like [Hibiscus syriacus]KAE8672891.1 Endochitinase 1 [Hibiscus syriacus]